MQPTGHQLAVCLAAVMPRAHAEEDLTLARVVADTVAVLHHCTKVKERVVVGYWDLQ